MHSQIKLGSVFGIKIGLHYSWFLIALLIVLSLSSRFHASNPAWGDGVILTVAVATASVCFIVVDKDEITGLVTPHEIKHVDRAKWPFTTLHDIMRPLEDLQSVAPDMTLTNALELMSRYDLNQLPVVSNKHLEGVLSRGGFSAICRHMPNYKGRRDKRDFKRFSRGR